VVVATRHDSHAELVIAALDAGKPVFVEKPLCITPDELDRIVRAVDTRERAGGDPFVMVGFNRRFAPSIQQVRARMSGRPVSIVYRINAGRSTPGSWIGDRTEGGGRVVGEVCHFVDLCAFIAASPIVEVNAIRSAAGEDDVAISLRMCNGSMATVAYLVDGSPDVPKERIEVFGGGDCAAIDDFRRVSINGRASSWRSALLRRQDKGHRAEMASFIEAIERRAPSPVSFASALNSTRATFAVLEALATGHPVRIP
jgi:predicted dehydrogenase